MSSLLRTLMLSLLLSLWAVTAQSAPASAIATYVALDAKGERTAPKAGPRPHPCVLDTASGLVWEVKTDDQGPGDKDWTYSWHDERLRADAFPSGYVDGGNCSHTGSCDTTGVVVDTNKRRLCGFGDWRMPTADELAGLLRPELPKKIDERFFPNTIENYYWSGTYVPLETGGAMLVSFAHGMSLAGNAAAAAAVRLVRGPDQP